MMARAKIAAAAFLTCLIAWLVIAIPTGTSWAQVQQKVYRIAIMSSSVPVTEMREGGDVGHGALLQELRRLGYVEGTNLVIERRSPSSTPEGIDEAAREIVVLQPDAILAVTGNLVRSLKAVTTTIPIVAMTTNPVETGLVASLARPGGNVTGMNFNAGVGIESKRMELLREVVPGVTRLAYLNYMISRAVSVSTVSIRQAAEAQGLTMIVVSLDDPINEQAVRNAFAGAVREGAEAIIVPEGPAFRTHAPLIVELAAQAGIPVIYSFKEVPQAGGLMSYGTDIADMYRHAARQIDKILKGANPADIPFEQPTIFELVINLRTARALGLTIPATLLAQATEVIE